MASSDNISIQLMQTIINSVKKNGVDGTLKILNSDTTSVDIDDENIKSIIDIVCEEFSINVDELIYDKYIRGDNKYAIGFCLFYLYHNYSVGEIQERGAFKFKDKSVLSRYRQLISNLDAKNKADIHYLKIKSRLDKKINNIKK